MNDFIVTLNNSFIENYADIHIWKHSESKNANMCNHIHTYNELEIIISGNGNNEINGNKIPVCTGSVYIVPPYISHRIELNDDLEIITVSFNDKIIKYPAVLSKVKGGANYCNLSNSQLENSIKTLDKIHNLIFSNGPFSKELISSLFNSLIIEILSDCETFNPYEFNSEIPAKLKDAISYITTHLQFDISLSNVAETINLSPNYLSALLKKHLGISYIDFICGLRLDKAKILMSANEFSISEISKRTGFNSSSYFTEKFKARFGISPSEYKNSLK